MPDAEKSLSKIMTNGPKRNLQMPTRGTKNEKAASGYVKGIIIVAKRCAVVLMRV